MNRIEDQLLARLFQETLGIDMPRQLDQDAALADICPSIFLALNAKYGFAGPYPLVYDSCGNKGIAFCVDCCDGAVKGVFLLSGNGYNLSYFAVMPNPESSVHNPALMTVRLVPGRKDHNSPKVVVDVAGTEAAWLGRIGAFDTYLFLSKIVQEDIMPLEKWTSAKIKEYGVSVYEFH